ncbi:probable ubiquitin carboxyl-terminal hydrolase MINDY-4 [Spea bombifrons]|uniref:probable ubiquitin carboxyl-terminal hydrolase MINDY-4 n=1 Tax=Spea bombifrons TaxID=233779 RepID=UPI00234966A4|nr:probable ubiquitin carboxyl-terminal hydrolase MINDY-4 [Spea bombifrons]
MDNSLVEAVASSLVREFLNRKGLRKSVAVLEEELPRTPQSISNRNALRAALHLDSLYQENKLTEKPLKTLLEILTKHFLEDSGRTKPQRRATEQNAEPPQMFIRSHRPKDPASTALDVYDVSDDDFGGSSAVSDSSKTENRRGEKSVTVYKPDQSKASRPKSTKSETDPKSRYSPSEGEINHVEETKPEVPRSPGSILDVKNSTPETQRPKSSRVVRGMMSGPVASSQEDVLKKRGQRRSVPMTASIGSKTDVQINELLGRRTEPSLASANSALQLGKEFSAKLLSTATAADSLKNASIGKPERQRNGTTLTERQACANERESFKFPSGGEKRSRPKKNENNPTSDRRTPISVSHEDDNRGEDLKLDDVEDDLVTAEIAKISVFPRSKIQVEGKAISWTLAAELKNLLFGSGLRCFSEEWKIQSFTFSNKNQLKYGFVQKKGGPCGVLAAVQGCFLKNLLFGKEGDSRTLQPSDTQRTFCLCKAVADILWRAGDRRDAHVALSSGRQQFSPAGRYKADGVLESIIVYRIQKYEDLLDFLQQNVSQFEFGPFGCILLTVSVVLSRSIELVQKDFDVPTNCLIGAHSYCTQELVNLILGGRAVSNVFNDVMELDSGNGNVTLLKGVAGRSDIGFLSLFEHYGACEVGSYLKTPRYPIWVVCSESHFSVLFCLRKELMNDWRIERRFDLYYYDGLANQQEEIRLTVDTADAYSEDPENDLIPPLECCIRTKWKGAGIDWNGTEPIL